MHEDFWRARWQRNEIGFHLPHVNPWLQRYWRGEPGARVLVPLCGKSLDMAWLAEQGFPVLGVELMESAVQCFFQEQGLEPEISDNGRFRCYRHGNIEIWSGDIFGLRADDVANCAWLYDRAALISVYGTTGFWEKFGFHPAEGLPQDKLASYASRIVLSEMRI